MKKAFEHLSYRCGLWNIESIGSIIDRAEYQQWEKQGLKKKIRRRIIIGIIITVIIAMAIVYPLIPSSDIKTIILGILSSIMGAIIYSAFSEAVFEDRMNELDIIQNMISAMEKTQSKGLLDVRKRSEYGTEFWIDFAGETNDKWIISGRALSRWMDDNIVEEFKSNIIM